MGQFSFKNELLAPLRKSLTEQFVFELAHLPNGPLLSLAKQTPGGWSHRVPFLKNASRIFKNRQNFLTKDLESIADHLPWFSALLSTKKSLFLEHADAINETLGGPRAMLLCVLWNLKVESKEEALGADVLTRFAAAGKPQANKPEAKALQALRQKLMGEITSNKEPAIGEPLDPADRTLRRLQQDLDKGKAAREKEITALKRHQANELKALDLVLEKNQAEIAALKVNLDQKKSADEANLASLAAKLAKAEDEAIRLRGELDGAREQVAKKAREIAEALLSEEIRPWLADARMLKAASEEVAKLRQLTTENVDKIRKAQRDADPFLAKEHELRQAIPQMEEMLKLLRRYQRTAGQVLPEMSALEQRITEHVEKVRYALERRDHPTDPFLERIAAKINEAEAAALKSIEAALRLSEESGLVDSRHADLYRRDIHKRRSKLADQAFHEHKTSGPLALLERAVAIGEPARLAVDGNNFACLRQEFLGLRLATKKNSQGDTRLLLDPAARQKVVQVLEKLANDATGLHLWVCFDGQASTLKFTNPRMKVTFSRAGAKADHDIMDLVAKDKTVESPWFVVTDDIEVRDAGTREGAHIIYNDALVRLFINRGIKA